MERCWLIYDGSELVMHKMQNVLGSTCFAKRVEPYRRDVLKSPQITPEVHRSMRLGHIFLLGLAKTVFLHCPQPLSKPKELPPPILQMGFRSLLSVIKVKKMDCNNTFFYNSTFISA